MKTPESKVQQANRCRRAGCQSPITNSIYCSKECYELDFPPPPATLTPYSKALETKLLSMGGSVVRIFDDDDEVECAEPDQFLHALLVMGRLSSGKGALLKRMEEGACHENAEGLAQQSPLMYQQETGYALGPGDGVWRRHSWVFDSRENQIVETTVLRDKYFGFTCQRHDDQIGDQDPVAPQQKNSAVPA